MTIDAVATAWWSRDGLDGGPPMAPVAEGDIVALLWAGGYLRAMSSRHCLREPAGSIFPKR